MPNLGLDTQAFNLGNRKAIWRVVCRVLPHPRPEETSANTPSSHLLTQQFSSFPSSLPLRG